MRRKRAGDSYSLGRWLWIAFLTIFLVGSWIYLIMPRPERVTEEVRVKAENEKPIHIQKIVLYDSKENGIRIDAEDAKMFISSGDVFFQNLSIQGPPEEGQPSLTLQAGSAKLSRKTGQITVQDGVKITMPTGQTIETETLLLKEKKGVIYGNQKVTMISGADTIRGDGLRYDIKNGTLEIFQPRILIPGL